MSTNLVCIGCDDGYAVTKVAVWDEATKKIITHAAPSIVVSGIQETDAEGRRFNSYLTEGQTFTVVKSGVTETQYDSYPKSSQNRVIVHHALRKLGLGGQSVFLCSGLPPMSYYIGNDGTTNTALVDEKIKSLYKGVRASDQSQLASIVKQIVTMEGLAAVYDEIINDDLDIGRELTGPVAVIDIGGRTTDCVVVRPSDHSANITIDVSKTKSKDIGVLKLLDILRSEIRKDEDYQSVHESDMNLSNLFTNGTFRVWGQDHPAQPYLDAAKKIVASELVKFLETTLRGGAGVDQVILVGGGAHVLGEDIKNFSKVRNPNFFKVAHEPEFANARGMLKLAMGHMRNQ